jgi:5-methylcytosine-specific restriction endonuclease McrA
MTDSPPRYNALVEALASTNAMSSGLPRISYDNAFSRMAEELIESSIIANRLRRIAWKQTAGGIYVLWCRDDLGWILHRDAEPGSIYAWDADHIIPRELGGSDDPLNLRALHSSANRSDGARLGNAMARYRRS